MARYHASYELSLPFDDEKKYRHETCTIVADNDNEAIIKAKEQLSKYLERYPRMVLEESGLLSLVEHREVPISR